MAQKFNIVAQLQLKGPSNLNRVVSQIQSKLQNVNAQINFQINKNAAQNVQAASNAAANLSKSSAAATKQVGSLSKATRAAGTSAQASAKNFQQASSAAASFGQQAALAVKRFAAFTVSAGILGGFVAAMKNGVTAAIDFERELIKVSQVTGKSVDSLSALTNQITALSKGMGVASAELVNVSRILSQTGMTADEVRVALKTLAQSSLAPTFKDMTNTAEGAIAIMRQFGVTADQLGKKLGSINALAGSFAVESQDLIFAIRRAGGAFKAAGGQLEELLALFTSVRATTRESAETIATGFRTIFTRMQRPKTIEFLRATGVELHNLEGNFVGPFEAVKRLSKALKQLESVDPRFQKIIEELGGFRQVSKVIPLIQQFATAQRALTVAQQGQGSLARDAAKAQETLAVKIIKVREQFLGLFRDIAGSKTFKTFADLALNMASSFIKVGDSLKPMLPLLASLAAFQGARMMTQFIGGFAGGMRGTGGGRGAGGVGNAVANRVTGQQSTANAVKHIQSLTMNTQALIKLSSSLVSTNQNIVKLSQSLTMLPRQLRLSLSGSGKRTFASGGMVPGHGNRDTVPAMLTPGEFVVRKDSVEKYGESNLQRMNRGSKVGDVSRARRLSGGAKGASYAGRRSKRFGKRMAGGAGKAYAFDFDDTLAESGAVVREGADDPYEDFRGKKGASLVRSAKATKIAGMARTRAARGHDIYVVTARPADSSTRSSIGQFMRGVGAPAKDVIGVGGTPGPGGTSEKKAQVLARLKKQYANITYLDDEMENVLAAAQVPGVKSIRAKKFFGGRIQRMSTGGKKKKSLPKEMNLIGPQRRIGGFYAKPSAGSSTQTYTDKTGFTIKPGRQGAGEQGKIVDGQFPILAPAYNPSANDKGMPKGTSLAAAIKDGATFGVQMALKKSMRNIRTKNVLPNMGTAKLNPKADPKILAEAKTDKQVAPTLGGYTYEGVIRSLTGVGAGKGLNPNFDIEDTTGFTDKLAGIYGQAAKSIQTAEVKLDKSKFGKADKGIIAKMKSDYNSKQFATTYVGRGPSKHMGHIGLASKVPESGRPHMPGTTAPLHTPQKKAMGGGISGSDTVPALLTPGEFVVNKTTAQRVGYGALHKINTGQAKGFAAGGVVTPGRHFYGDDFEDGWVFPKDTGGLRVTEGPAEKKKAAVEAMRQRDASKKSRQGPPSDPPPDDKQALWDRLNTTNQPPAPVQKAEKKSGVVGKLIGGLKDHAKAIHENAKGWLKDRKREPIQKKIDEAAGIKDTSGPVKRAVKSASKVAMDVVAKSVTTTGKVAGKGNRGPYDLPPIPSGLLNRVGPVTGESASLSPLNRKRRLDPEFRDRAFGNRGGVEATLTTSAMSSEDAIRARQKQGTLFGAPAGPRPPIVTPPGPIAPPVQMTPQLAPPDIGKREAAIFSETVQKLETGGKSTLEDKVMQKMAGGLDKAEKTVRGIGGKLWEQGKKRVAQVKQMVSVTKQNITATKSWKGGRGLGQLGVPARGQGTRRGQGGVVMSAGAGVGGGGGGGMGGGMGGGGMGAGMKLQMTMMLAANATQVLGQMFGKMPPALEKMIGAVNQSVITFSILKQTLSMLGGMGKPGGMLSKLQGPVGGVIAAFVTLGMVVKSFGDDMKKAALEKVKEAKTDAEAAAAAQEYEGGKKVSGVGTGMAVGGGVGAVVGAVLGSVIPGLGTVIGGVVGGAVGSAIGGIVAPLAQAYFGPSKEIIQALQQGKMSRIMSGMATSLKKIEKHGPTLASSMRVATGAEGMVTQMTGATPENFKDFQQQSKGQLPAMQGFVDKLAKGTNTYEEFANKFAGAGERTLQAMAKIQEVPFEDLKKELVDQIELTRKVNEANKAQEAALRAHKDLTGTIYNLRDAFNQAAAAVGVFAQESGFIESLYGGGDVGATFGGAGIKSGILGRAAKGESVDPGELAAAIDQVSPNADIAKQAKETAKMINQLPNILTMAAVQGSDDNKLTKNFEEALKAHGFDADSAMAKGLKASIQGATASRSKSEGTLIGKIREDPRKVAKDMMSKATPEILDALESVGQAIIKTQQHLLKILSSRNKMEQAAVKQRLRVQTASDRLADTNRKLAGGVDSKASFAQIQARDLQKQRITLGAGSNKADVSALAGDPAAMGNFLRATNDAIVAKRKEIDAMGQGSDQHLAAERTLKDMELASKRARAGLEEVATGGAALAKAQEELASATKDREFRKDKMVSEVIFGDKESQQSFTEDVAGAQALASGAMNPQDLPKEMRQRQLGFLKGLGDEKQQFLGGKSGTEVVKESSERQLREMFKGQLSSGQMSEESFQGMVDAYFKASQTEIDVLKEIKAINEAQERAELELLHTIEDGIDSQDLLVAKAINVGNKAIMDALNRVAVLQAEANKNAALARKATADEKVQSLEKLEEETGLTGKAAVEASRDTVAQTENINKALDEQLKFEDAADMPSGFADQGVAKKLARDNPLLGTAAGLGAYVSSMGNRGVTDINAMSGAVGGTGFMGMGGANRSQIGAAAETVGQTKNFELMTKIQDQIAAAPEAFKSAAGREDLVRMISTSLKEGTGGAEGMGEAAFEGEGGMKMLNTLANKLAEITTTGNLQNKSGDLISMMEQTGEVGAVAEARGKASRKERDKAVTDITGSEMPAAQQERFLEMIQGRGETAGMSDTERKSYIAKELEKINTNLETLENAGGVDAVRAGQAAAQVEVDETSATLIAARNPLPATRPPGYRGVGAGVPPTGYGAPPTGVPPGAPPTMTLPTVTTPTGVPPIGVPPTGVPPTGVPPTGAPLPGAPPIGHVVSGGGTTPYSISPTPDVAGRPGIDEPVAGTPEEEIAAAGMVADPMTMMASILQSIDKNVAEILKIMQGGISTLKDPAKAIGDVVSKMSSEKSASGMLEAVGVETGPKGAAEAAKALEKAVSTPKAAAETGKAVEKALKKGSPIPITPAESYLEQRGQAVAISKSVEKAKAPKEAVESAKALEKAVQLTNPVTGQPMPQQLMRMGADIGEGNVRGGAPGAAGAISREGRRAQISSASSFADIDNLISGAQSGGYQTYEQMRQERGPQQPATEPGQYADWENQILEANDFTPEQFDEFTAWQEGTGAGPAGDAPAQAIEQLMAGGTRGGAAAEIISASMGGPGAAEAAEMAELEALALAEEKAAEGADMKGPAGIPPTVKADAAKLSEVEKEALQKELTSSMSVIPGLDVPMPKPPAKPEAPEADGVQYYGSNVTRALKYDKFGEGGAWGEMGTEIEKNRAMSDSAKQRFKQLSDDAQSGKGPDFGSDEYKKQEADITAQRDYAESQMKGMFTNKKGELDEAEYEKAMDEGLWSGEGLEETQARLKEEYVKNREDAKLGLGETLWAAGKGGLKGLGNVSRGMTGAAYTVGGGVLGGVSKGLGAITGSETLDIMGDSFLSSGAAGAKQLGSSLANINTGEGRSVYQEDVIDKMAPGALREGTDWANWGAEVTMPLGPGGALIGGGGKAIGAGVKAGSKLVGKGATKVGAKKAATKIADTKIGQKVFGKTATNNKAMKGGKNIVGGRFGPGGAVPRGTSGFYNVAGTRQGGLMQGLLGTPMQVGGKVAQRAGQGGIGQLSQSGNLLNIGRVGGKLGRGSGGRAAMNFVSGATRKTIQRGGQGAKKFLPGAGKKAAGTLQSKLALFRGLRGTMPIQQALKQSGVTARQVMKSGRASTAGLKTAGQTAGKVSKEVVKKPGLIAAAGRGAKTTGKIVAGGGLAAGGAALVAGQVGQEMMQADMMAADFGSGKRDDPSAEANLSGRVTAAGGGAAGGAGYKGDKEIQEYLSERARSSEARPVAGGGGYTGDDADRAHWGRAGTRGPLAGYGIRPSGSSGLGTTPGAAGGGGFSAERQAAGLEVQRQMESSAKHRRGGGGIDYSNAVQQKRFKGAIAKRKKVTAGKLTSLGSAGIDTRTMKGEDVKRKSREMERKRKKEIKGDSRKGIAGTKATVGAEDIAQMERLSGDPGSLTGKRLAKSKSRTSQKIAELRKSGADVSEIKDKKGLNKKYQELAAKQKEEWYAKQGRPGGGGMMGDMWAGVQGAMRDPMGALQGGVQSVGQMFGIEDPMGMAQAAMQDPMGAAKQGLSAMGIPGFGGGGGGGGGMGGGGPQNIAQAMEAAGPGSLMGGMSNMMMMGGGAGPSQEMMAMMAGGGGGQADMQQQIIQAIQEGLAGTGGAAGETSGIKISEDQIAALQEAMGIDTEPFANLSKGLEAFTSEELIQSLERFTEQFGGGGVIQHELKTDEMSVNINGLDAIQGDMEKRVMERTLSEIEAKQKELTNGKPA